VDNDMSLGIQLTADASSAIEGTTLTQESLDRLEAAIASLVAGIEPLNGMFEQMLSRSTAARSGLDSASSNGSDVTATRQRPSIASFVRWMLRQRRA
jgi:hypothetical protein